MGSAEPDSTFLNHGRWHPLVRIAAYMVALAAAALVLILPVTVPFVPRNVGPEELSAILVDPNRPLLLPVAWLQLLAVALATYIITVRLDRQPAAAIGLRLHPGWPREILLGLALGFVLVVPIFGLLVALGLAHVVPSAGDAGRALAIGILTMVPVALSEEIMFRGYLLRNLTQAYGAWRAVVITSLAFSALHLSNPGAEHNVLASVNIFLAGVLMGYPYLRTGSLWLPVGMHFSWNFTQSALLGMPVSGLGLPGVIRTSLLPPYWLSGGAFGPEGSILAVLAMLGGILWLGRRFGGFAPLAATGGRRAEAPEQARSDGELQ